VGNPGLFPEAALQLFHILLYCMAYIFGGAALIALSVYIVLVCSEIFSQPRSKGAKVPQPARRVPVAEETLVLSPAETPILAAPGRLGEEAGWVTAPPHGAQIPMTVPANLESEPTWT
jgi:hypothetical protein